MKRGGERSKSDHELREVVELRHPDPHHVLGLHLDKDGVTVRVFRPDATGIDLLPDFGGRVAMRHRLGGIWEVKLNGQAAAFSYHVEVHYRDASFVIKDPYSFLPTL